METDYTNFITKDHHSKSFMNFHMIKPDTTGLNKLAGDNLGLLIMD